MSAKDDSEPIANTEMFRAFTARELEAKKSTNRTPALIALLVVLVVAVVVIAVLALR
ncbi:MAG TPA: hypothetical protein VHX59_19750 [Mycobacteriales bacterium]|jgi:hypothetical protein|nr:hypothetical protein [Mycobacteriales bacterium]